MSRREDTFWQKGFPASGIGISVELRRRVEDVHLNIDGHINAYVKLCGQITGHLSYSLIEQFSSIEGRTLDRLEGTGCLEDEVEDCFRFLGELPSAAAERTYPWNLVPPPTPRPDLLFFAFARCPTLAAPVRQNSVRLRTGLATTLDLLFMHKGKPPPFGDPTAWRLMQARMRPRRKPTGKHVRHGYYAEIWEENKVWFERTIDEFQLKGKSIRDTVRRI